MCEHFGCLPLDAIENIRRLPAGYLEQVMEYDAYRHAYHYVARTAPKDLPRDDDMVNMVREIETEAARQAIEAADQELSAGA